MPVVRSALCGTGNVEELAREHIEGIKQFGRDNPSYLYDLIGPDDASANSFFEGLSIFYAMLRSLRNQDTILVDGSLDGICGSACIGTHCRAPASVGAIGDDDLHALQDIRSVLQRSDLKRWVDWSMIGDESPFILVKAGSLRKIFKIRSLNHRI